MEKITMITRPNRDKAQKFMLTDRLRIEMINFFSEDREITFFGQAKGGFTLSKLSIKGEIEHSKKPLKDRPHYVHVSYNPPATLAYLRVPASALKSFEYLGERKNLEHYRIQDMAGQIFIITQEVGKKPANFFRLETENPNPAETGLAGIAGENAELMPVPQVGIPHDNYWLSSEQLMQLSRLTRGY